MSHHGFFYVGMPAPERQGSGRVFRGTWYLAAPPHAIYRQ